MGRIWQRGVQVAHADEVRTVLHQGDELLPLRLGELAVGDIAGDLGCAYDIARVVFDRRYGERHEDALPVAAHALGLKVLDPLAGFQLRDDLVFLSNALRWNDERDMPAYRVALAVSEQPLSAGVPALNDALQRFADDGIIG
jgi:hypothetical protein